MGSNKKKKMTLSLLILAVMIVLIGGAYAFIQLTLTGTRNVVITAGTLSLILEEDENNLYITNALPMYDEVGMIQEPFTFRLINNGTISANYVVKLVEINTVELERSDVKYGLTKDGERTINLVSNIEDGVIDSGTIAGEQIINYTLRLWIRDDLTNMEAIENKTLSLKLSVEVEQNVEIYKEEILNGADPVLTNNLVPVTIANDGAVTKADLNSAWYDYDNQIWANAVVLIDNTQVYDIGATIPESNIESYFVWIPKYSYKLWDLGNYSEVTTTTNKEQTIEIKFGTTNTSDSVTGECTTPGVAGESGNCEVGEYMTHPAFLAFDTTGLWVGKFEAGYNGATSTTGAEVNSSDSSKLIVKPNVYSWRNITVGNAFKVSYDYLREEESHLIKNTEWGAVAYLQYSIYGSRASVRINNNSAFITGYAGTEEPTLGYNAGTSITGNYIESTALNTDGTNTKRYNTTTGYLGSTTGNISGVYDMSGGAWEYVMGYNIQATTDKSVITTLYSDFFTNSVWDKYYDKYSNSGTHYQNYNNRILGDSMGEMGPFGSQVDPDGVTRYISSWYGDYAHFAMVSDPWFGRSGNWYYGSGAGTFSFNGFTGGVSANISFRPVLAP